MCLNKFPVVEYDILEEPSHDPSKWTPEIETPIFSNEHDSPPLPTSRERKRGIKAKGTPNDLNISLFDD